MGKKRIQGVIFDLDGTLYSITFPKLKLALTLLRDLKILRHLSPARDCLRGKSYSDGPALRAALYEELGKRAGVDSARARIWYEDRFLRGFIKMLGAHARMRPGLVDLLSLLKRRGVKLAVVSDYGCVAERLVAIGVPLDVFDDLAAAEDFGTLKPSSKPYMALANKWKLDPEHVVLVGDREDIDEESAIAADMGFLGIEDSSGPKRSEKQYSSWRDVANELESRTALLQESLNESI